MANSIQRSNDPVLDRIVKGYTPNGMVRNEVLTKVNVTANTGDILSQGSEHIRIQNNVRVGRSQTPEMTFSIAKTAGWKIQRYGLKILVTEEDGTNWNPTNPSQGMQQAKNNMAVVTRNAQMLAAENALAGVIQTAGSYSAGNKITLSGTSQFNDYTNSDPIGVFQDGKEAVYDATGLLPNTAVVPWEVWNQLKFHPDLLSKLSGNKDAFKGITDEQLAQILEVDTVLIPSVKKNTAAQGATRVLESVWGKHINLFYKDPSPNTLIAKDSFGFTFQKKAVTGDSYKQSDPKNSEFVRVEEFYDDVITDFDAGYIIVDAVA